MKPKTNLAAPKAQSDRKRTPLPLARYAILAGFALATASLAVGGVMYVHEKVTSYFAWVAAERVAQYEAGYAKGQRELLIDQANKKAPTLEIKGKEVWARVEVLTEESPAEEPLPGTTDQQIEAAATAAANMEKAQFGKAGKKGKTD